MRISTHFLAIALPLAAAACVGTIGDDGDKSDGNGNSDALGDDGVTGAEIAALRCTTPAVGPTPMRRMSGREYARALVDLVGTADGVSFTEAVPKQGFDNDLAQGLDDGLSLKLVDSAIAVAERLDAAKLTGCSSGDDGCVDAFVRRFGRRAFRRTLSEDEATRLSSAYRAGSSAEGFATGVRAVVAAVLTSPNFLFQVEAGNGAPTVPNAVHASSFEVASRLSSFLWASVPDEELLDAAGRDELQTKEQIAVQARRMLGDARAKEAIASFYEQWFGLGSLVPGMSKTDPEYGDALRMSMIGETQRFISNVIWNGAGTVSSFFSAKESFVDAPLAKLYGIPTPAKDFDPITLPPERQGIFTQASFLTAFSGPGKDVAAPIKRGLALRTRFLCLGMPDRPDVIPPTPDVQPGQTTRDTLAAHTQNEPCKSCHQGFDGFGFGLEAFDAIGRYRTMDEGKPVDASGWFEETDVDGDYNGAIELSNKIASSRQVRDCASVQYVRFALGRVETSDDVCAIVTVRDAAAASDGSVQEMLLAVTQTDAFSSYRRTE